MSSTLHHLAGRLFLSNKNQLPKLFTFNHNLSSERKQAADSQKTLWVFLSPLFDMKKKKNDVIASQSEKWLMKRTKIAYHNRSFRVFDRAQKSFPFYSHSFWFQSRKRKKNCVNSFLTWQNGFSVIIHWVWCILLLRVKLSVAFWMLQRGAGICSLLILPVNYHPIHRQFIVGVTDFQQHQAVIRLSTLSYLIILTM